MRYVTVVMRPAGEAESGSETESESGADSGGGTESGAEAFHPVGGALAEDPDLTREAIHAVEPLDDGTVAMLTEVRGDLDRYGEIMAEAPTVHEYAVSGDGSGYCYCRVDLTPLTQRLVDSNESGEFVVEFPIKVTDDGGHRLTLVGREEDFAAAPVTFPDGVEMELVSTGPYHPDAERVFAGLTDRQREVLEVSIRLGYYENPREATHRDIAEEVGVEPGTVGKHLRKVESHVFSKYVV